MNYLIHNGSRARHNRTQRAALPQHGGHKQYVCKGELRLIRGQPLTVNEDQLLEHRDELIEKEAQGLLYVTDTEKRPVNLDTLEVGIVAPASPPADPPLDSVADDKAAGLSFVNSINEPPPPNEFAMPVPPPAAALDVPMAETSVETPVEDQAQRAGKGKGKGGR